MAADVQSTKQDRVPMSKFIGKAFKHYRLRLEWTQSDLAAFLAENEGFSGINQSYISRLESGDVFPTAERFRQICDVLHCSASELWEKAEKYANESQGENNIDAQLECLGHPKLGVPKDRVDALKKIVYEKISDVGRLLDSVDISLIVGNEVPLREIQELRELANEVPFPPEAVQLLLDLLRRATERHVASTTRC